MSKYAGFFRLLALHLAQTSFIHASTLTEWLASFTHLQFLFTMYPFLEGFWWHLPRHLLFSFVNVISPSVFKPLHAIAGTAVNPLLAVLLIICLFSYILPYISSSLSSVWLPSFQCHISILYRGLHSSISLARFWRREFLSRDILQCL